MKREIVKIRNNQLFNKTSIIISLIILNLVQSQMPGLSPDSPFYGLTNNGVISFDSMAKYQMSSMKSIGSCFISKIGSGLE